MQARIPSISAVLLLLGLCTACVPAAHAVPILGVPMGTAGFVGQSSQGPPDVPTLVTSYAEFVGVFGDGIAGLSNPWLAPSVLAFFANGGQRLYVVRVVGGDDASFIGVDLGPGSRTGLQALLDVDEVSVVAIPGNHSPPVQAAMIAHCELAGDRVALLDPAADADVETVLDQRAGLDSTKGFAALYFPWVVDAPMDASLTLPPSGYVAGVFAATPPPDSPVAILANATDVSYSISNAEQDLLNPQGVNAIRYFSGQGVRIWGARTIASDPEWIYVAVRRTALYLEESIYEGTEWAIFEPNDATLWAQLSADVGDFLYARWLEGWFQGSTPEDAYFVRCGLSTTMTQTDIEEGRTIIELGFAPLLPAEFLLLRVTQQRSSSTAVGPVRPRVVLHPAAPNPFNPRTAIRFDLENAVPVRLEVYDTAGRRVRVLLADRQLESGGHRVLWDGLDDGGRSLASGVYRVWLQANGESGMTSVVLIK